MILRLVAVLVLAVLLTGCGFQLRRDLVLPPDLGPVRVVSGDRYSPLADDIARALAHAGAAPAAADATAVASLHIVAEAFDNAPLAVDTRARVREYVTTYNVVFEFSAADGSALVPRQTVTLSRSYTFDSFGALGTASEQEVIQEELRRDMAGAVLRRIDVALRTATP